MKDNLRSLIRAIDSKLNLPARFRCCGNLSVLELHNSHDWLLTYDNGKDARYYILSNSQLLRSKKIRSALIPAQGSNYDFSSVCESLTNSSITMLEVDHTQANSI